MTKSYKGIGDNLVQSLKKYILLWYNKLLSIFTLLKKTLGHYFGEKGLIKKKGLTVT